MTQKLTLTFAGDEAGDISLSFDKGASRFFVVAVIATPDPDALRGLLAKLKTEAGLPTQFEFGFNHLSNLLRERTLTALSHANFSSWAIVIDKPNLSDTFKVMRRYQFYLFFVTELLKQIPSEKREGATLILDEYGSAQTLYTELNRYLKARDIPRHFKRIQIRRSKSEPLIQVADIVAGTILRRDSVGDAESFEKLERKFVKVFEFKG